MASKAFLNLFNLSSLKEQFPSFMALPALFTWPFLAAIIPPNYFKYNILRHTLELPTESLYKYTPEAKFLF